MNRTESNGLTPIFRMLVAHRLVVYFGGLVVIGLPLLFGALDLAFPGTARTVIVGVTLAVMVFTYIGEWRLDHADPGVEPTTEEYSRRTRLAFGVALVGIAVGLYVALEGDTAAGVLFIGGAYLFGYLGYRADEAGE